VFWIDELENTFSGNRDAVGADGGVGQRLFGAFLTWMQEKNDEVFLVATANDISGLPPELLGKGRFDEIFFVDLPTAAERAEILNVQIKSHHLTASDFALKQVAAATNGFSGAEIEQLVTTVMLKSLHNKLKLSTESVLTETKLFVPLSKSRAEEIDKLRALGKARFCPAG
jgi:SpoVK/Ycf46/Vps4 family AAA+-type ATPase